MLKLLFSIFLKKAVFIFLLEKSNLNFPFFFEKNEQSAEKQI
jgi:hypothetical protein